MSQAPVLKAAVYDGLCNVFPQDSQAVLVTYGMPWNEDAQDLVAVTGARTTPKNGGVGPMGPRRVHDEVIEVTVTFSSFRGGGNEVTQTASEACWAMVTQLEEALRADPLLGLGPSAVFAMRFTEGEELPEEDTPDVITKGRVSTIEVTITGTSRIF